MKIVKSNGSADGGIELTAEEIRIFTAYRTMGHEAQNFLVRYSEELAGRTRKKLSKPQLYVVPVCVTSGGGA